MRHAILIGLGCLLLAACTESNQPPKPKAGYLPDSVAQGDPAAGNPATQPGGPPMSQNDADFRGLNDARIAKVFVSWKIGTLDPMDAFPQYKTAMRTDIRRLVRSQPIANDFGKAVYPRILFKAYRFASSDALQAEVATWLNSHSHSGGDIVLGKPVATFKSPPLLCYTTATDLVVAQWSCVYGGADWDADVGRFFAAALEDGATCSWEVTCGTGEFRYHKLPAS
jgi:hypothetical protein